MRVQLLKQTPEKNRDKKNKTLNITTPAPLNMPIIKIINIGF
jgi:hypothetical protein